MWNVYQLLGDTELLYVGYSRWLKQRLGCHRREKPWWPEVTDIWSEEFATEGEARLREKELWAAEHPKYNRVSPFRTAEERREEARVRSMSPEAYEAKLARARKRDRRGQMMTPEGLEASRDYDRKRSQTPERRARKQTPEYRAYSRAYNRAYDRDQRQRPKRWPQTGPGLF